MKSSKRGLLTPIEGPVLKLMKSESYFTRSSVETLTQRIADRIKREAPPDCTRLRVALRACDVRTAPWAGIVQAILEGRLEVFAMKSDKSRHSLADRLAVRDAADLSSLMAQEVSGKPSPAAEWIGNATASEILGVNGTVVWRLTKVGALKKQAEAPLYSHFKRSEVERLNDQMIFTPEMVQAGHFRTYREASTGCGGDVVPTSNSSGGGWSTRADEVELKRARRRVATETRAAAGPEVLGTDRIAQGKLAAKQELSDASRIGYRRRLPFSAAVFAVQKLAANGHLKARGGTTPFHRTEVEALAKRIVFVPEIMRLSGYVSHVGVTNWLKNVGIERVLAEGRPRPGVRADRRREARRARRIRPQRASPLDQAQAARHGRARQQRPSSLDRLQDQLCDRQEMGGDREGAGSGA